jgi:hypothetical protein
VSCCSALTFGRRSSALVSSYPERNLVKTLVFQAFWSEGIAIDMNFAAKKIVPKSKIGLDNRAIF